MKIKAYAISEKKIPHEEELLIAHINSDEARYCADVEASYQENGEAYIHYIEIKVIKTIKVKTSGILSNL